MEVDEAIDVEVPVAPKQNGNGDLEKYYNYLKSKGADVPPTYDSFHSTLQNEESAKKYYDYVKSKGYDAPPTFESFSNTLGLKKKTSLPDTNNSNLTSKNGGTSEGILESPSGNGLSSSQNGNGEVKSPSEALLSNQGESPFIPKEQQEVQNNNPQNPTPFPSQQNDLTQRGRLSTDITPYQKVPLEIGQGIHAATQKLAVNPNDDAALYELGYYQNQLGNTINAENFFSQALEKNPNNANALIGLGSVNSKSKNYGEALSNYEKALALTPARGVDQQGKEVDNPMYAALKQSIAQNQLDIAKGKRGTPEELQLLTNAQNNVNEALKLNPTDVRSLTTKSLLQTQNNEPEEAAKTMTEAQQQYAMQNVPVATIYSRMKEAQAASGEPDTRSFAEQYFAGHENLAQALGGGNTGKFLADALDIPGLVINDYQGLKAGLTKGAEGIQQGFEHPNDPVKTFGGLVKALSGGAEAAFSVAMATPAGMTFQEATGLGNYLVNETGLLPHDVATKIITAPLTTIYPVQNEIGKDIEGMADVAVSLMLLHEGTAAFQGKKTATQQIIEKIRAKNPLTGEETNTATTIVQQQATPQNLKKISDATDAIPDGTPKNKVVNSVNAIVGNGDVKQQIDVLNKEANEILKKDFVDTKDLMRLDEIDTETKKINDGIDQQVKEQLDLTIPDFNEEYTSLKKEKDELYQSTDGIQLQKDAEREKSINKRLLELGLQRQQIRTNLLTKKLKDNALNERKVEVSDQLQHKGTETIGTTNETSNSDQSISSGEIKPQEVKPEEVVPKPTVKKVLGKEVEFYRDYLPSKEKVNPDAVYSFTAKSKEGLPELLQDRAKMSSKGTINGVYSENWNASINGDELANLYEKSTPTEPVTPPEGKDVSIKDKGVGEKSVLNQGTDLKGAEKETWMMTDAEFDKHWLENGKKDVAEEVQKEKSKISKEKIRLEEALKSDPTNPANSSIQKEIAELDKKSKAQDERLTAKTEKPSEFMSNAQKRHHKGIDEALENKDYHKAIKEGRMTAKDAATIIESAGLEVPKDIENLANKDKGVEQPVEQKPQKIISPENKTQNETEKTKTKAKVLEPQPEVPEKSKVDVAKDKVTKAGDKLKAALKAKGLPEGVKKSGITIDDLVDGAVKLIHEAIDTGVEIGEAVKRGLDHIKNSDWYKSLTDEERKDSDAALNEHLQGVAENRVGVHHGALGELADKLGLDEPERGQYVEPEEYAKRGRKLLENGANPDEVNNIDNPLHDRISIARAHLEDLVGEADAIGKEHGFDSKEYESAREKVNDYANNVVKKLGTSAHRAMVSLQGKRDLDTGSFTAVKREVEKATDKNTTKEQDAKIKELTEKNAELKKQAEEAEKKLIEATTENISKEKGTRKQQAKVKLDEARIAFRKAAGLSSGGLEALPEFAKLVKAYVEYGFESAIEAFDQFKKDFPKANVKQEDFEKHYNEQSEKTPKGELKDLQKQFADKNDLKFTPEESKSIWDYAKKTYLDHGVSYRDMISNLTDDLGLSWRQVMNAISSPKTERTSDAMWRKQAEYAKMQNHTKNWVEAQRKSWAQKALKGVSGAFRGLSVFGHGGLFMGTHAGMTLFQPSTWKYTIPAFFRGWKFAYGNDAVYERRIEELKNSPNYITAQRGGLKNNPDVLNAEEYQKSQKFLGKLGLAGQKGFNSIKILRQDLFDYHFNRLTNIQKQDPRVAMNIARIVNNATGATNLKVPEWLNEVSFAGGMESARWGKLLRNPAKSTEVALRTIVDQVRGTKNVSEGDKVFAKIWARRVGEQLATYVGLLGVNAVIQGMTNPKNPTNITNPKQSDWLKFKFGDTTIDPTSGMVSTFNFIKGLGMASMENKSVTERTKDIGKNALGYGRGKLAPLYSTAADFAMHTDFYGNPLPFSDEKPEAGKHKLSWGEYAWQKAPIPVAEAAHVAYQSAIDNGLTKLQVDNIFKGILSGAISGSTGFRVGEYEEREQPFTDKDKQEPAFKYFIDKGLELPNTSLNYEKVHDEKSKTVKSISEYPKEKQDQYLKSHKAALKSELSEIKERGYVYVNDYGEVSINKPDKSSTGNPKQTSLGKLTKEQLAEILHLSQSKATETAKDEVFGTTKKSGIQHINTIRPQ